MPPPDNDVKAKPLTPQELGLIKLWIDQGAKGEVKAASARSPGSRCRRGSTRSTPSRSRPTASTPPRRGPTRFSCITCRASASWAG